MKAPAPHQEHPLEHPLEHRLEHRLGLPAGNLARVLHQRLVQHDPHVPIAANRNLSQGLARALVRDLAHRPDRALARGLAHQRNRSRALVRVHQSSLDHGLVLTRAHVQAPASDLSRGQDLHPAPTKSRGRGLVHARHPPLNPVHVQDLSRPLAAREASAVVLVVAVVEVKADQKASNIILFNCHFHFLN